MIFATVGTQLPFDRLLEGLETWAQHNPDVPIMAQSGSSKRRFSHIRTVQQLGQTEFNKHLTEARLIVAHAGMGTILTATELGKPVVLMPRRTKFGEHRTNHQVHTAREMVRLSNVTVVEDREALHKTLDLALSRGFGTHFPNEFTNASGLDPLIETVREFVWSEAGTRKSKLSSQDGSPT